MTYDNDSILLTCIKKKWKEGDLEASVSFSLMSSLV